MTQSPPPCTPRLGKALSLTPLPHLCPLPWHYYTRTTTRNIISCPHDLQQPNHYPNQKQPEHPYPQYRPHHQSTWNNLKLNLAWTHLYRQGQQETELMPHFHPRFMHGEIPSHTRQNALTVPQEKWPRACLRHHVCVHTFFYGAVLNYRILILVSLRACKCILLLTDSNEK